MINTIDRIVNIKLFHNFFCSVTKINSAFQMTLLKLLTNGYLTPNWCCVYIQEKLKAFGSNKNIMNLNKNHLI